MTNHTIKTIDEWCDADGYLYYVRAWSDRPTIMLVQDCNEPGYRQVIVFDELQTAIRFRNAIDKWIGENGGANVQATVQCEKCGGDRVAMVRSLCGCGLAGY